MVGFGTDYQHLVAQVEDGVAVGDAQLTVVNNARAHEVTVQEVVNLQQRLTFQVFVCYLQMHLVGLLVGVLLLHRFQALLFLFQLHLAEIPYQDGGTYDTQHTERISTGVGRGYLGRIAAEHRSQCFVCSTETRGVGDGAVKRTHHHRQVGLVAGVKEDEVAAEHHQDVEQDGSGSQPVELDALGAEALEETRSHLHTDHEYEEYQSEVLYESEDGGRGGEPNVTSHDAGKQHEGHAKRDAEHFDLAEVYAHGNDDGIKQRNMSHRVGSREQFFQPMKRFHINYNLFLRRVNT